MTSPMEYKNFIFRDITYKNGPERDPLIKLKYRAESTDDGTPKKAKDKFEELPQKDFREVWNRLLEFWKMNMEHVLTQNEPQEGTPINWNLRTSRIQRIKIKWESGDPVAVKYIAKVSTGFDETEKIPTPYVQPAMQEGELDAIKDICEYAKRFLRGERDQSELQFKDSPNEGTPNEDNPNDEPESKEESESEERPDLSNIF